MDMSCSPKRCILFKRHKNDCYQLQQRKSNGKWNSRQKQRLCKWLLHQQSDSMWKKHLKGSPGKRKISNPKINGNPLIPFPNPQWSSSSYVNFPNCSNLTNESLHFVLWVSAHHSLVYQKRLNWNQTAVLLVGFDFRTEPTLKFKPHEITKSHHSWPRCMSYE